MTTHSSALRSSSSPARSWSIGHIALWVLQVAVAGQFLFAGALKLTGNPQMVASFEAIGIGQWFRFLTGGIEVTAAFALLTPMFAVFGALALIATMIGAVITHVFILGGSSTPAVMLLVGSAVIAWARRDQLRLRAM